MTDEDESTDPGMIGAGRAILKFLRGREANEAIASHEGAREDRGTSNVNVMVIKDTKRFPDTSGWAYAQFPYDAASDTFTPSGSDAKCGHACHTTVAAKDYTFTAYPKR